MKFMLQMNVTKGPYQMAGWSPKPLNMPIEVRALGAPPPTN